MKRIATIGLAVVLLLSLLIAAPASAAEYGTVVGGYLRLRTAPSFDATILKSYYTGTVVEILGTSGDWYNVKTPDNKAGYMHSDYITLGGSGSSSATTMYVTSSNGYGVRLRTGPSKGYRVLGVYAVGIEVTVLQSGVIWSRIQIGTTVGFMMSEFLTATDPGSSPSTPEGDDMATVWSSNGYGVRLRSGPSTSYSIIGLYSVGTRVDVQTRDTDWDYIRVGSRLGYMMNEFLIYDDPDETEATGITVTADYATGMQGEYVDLDVTVTGTDLSSPAYTLEITGNASMAEISGDDVHILSTATVGAVIEITATTTDEDSGGSLLSDTCTVTVTASEPRVTGFAFDDTETTVSIAGGDVERRVGYTISGYNLTSPYFSLAVSPEAGGNVTTSIDESNEEIVLDISSAITDGTVFTVTGTTTADDAGGNPITAVLTVTITSDTLTLISIELIPEDTTLRHNESTNINARLHYSDGSYVTATITTGYTLNITSGSAYAALGGKLLVPDEPSLVGVTDQTIEITGTSVEDPTLTDTCEVLLYGRNEPGSPTLTSAVPANESVTLTWTAPANDGGEALSGYTAYYSFTDGGATTALPDAIGASDTSHTFNGLTNDDEYFFYLVATNGQGDSELSNGLSATPNPTTPSEPKNLVVTQSDGSVMLAWDEPDDTGGTGVTIDYYKVYLDGGGGTDVYAMNYTWSSLTNGVNHEFTVLAVNSATTGLPSSVISCAVGQPDAPIIGSRNADFEEISITWSAGADDGGNEIQSYDVYIKEASADDSTAIVDTVTTTYYTFTCTSYTDYEYWVVADNGIYESDESVRETLSPSYVLPGAPTNLTVDVTVANQATLAWDPPSDTGGQAITHYKITYTPTGGSPESGHEVAAATETLLIESLPGGSYTFYVYASNDDGVHYATAYDSVTDTVID